MASAPTIELQDGRTIPRLGFGTYPLERIAENIEVFDFELSDAEMALLAEFDRDNRLGGDPDTHVEL